MKYSLVLFICSLVYIIPTKSIRAQEVKNSPIKFYNFDDLLIDGKIKKPQVLWVDTKQKVKFEKLLKLKKDFMIRLKNTKKDPSLR